MGGFLILSIPSSKSKMRRADFQPVDMYYYLKLAFTCFKAIV